MRTTLSAICTYILVFALTVAPVPTKTSAQPVPLPHDEGEREHVDLTWFSIANWMFEVGDLHVLMDGYITRVPDRLSFLEAAADWPSLVKARLGFSDVQYFHFGFGGSAAAGESSRPRLIGGGCLSSCPDPGESSA